MVIGFFSFAVSNCSRQTTVLNAQCTYLLFAVLLAALERLIDSVEEERQRIFGEDGETQLGHRLHQEWKEN